MRQVEKYRLWLGHVGDARDLKSLYSVGIEAVMDLALEESPNAGARDMVYCRIPLLDDTGNPDCRLRLAIDTLVNLLRSDTPTLVHCGGGINRTPVVAAAAIALIENSPLRETLSRITAGWSCDISPGLFRHVDSLLDLPNGQT